MIGLTPRRRQPPEGGARRRVNVLHHASTTAVVLALWSVATTVAPSSAGQLPTTVTTPRVLLYVFDPIMENMGGQRMHDAYGWQDPVTLTNSVISDLRTSSHGNASYEVVDTQIVDEYPRAIDGFQYDDASFDIAWRNRDFHSGPPYGDNMFDYRRFLERNDIVPRINSGDIDEVWIYSGPDSGTWESTMVGDGSYWLNSSPVPIDSDRAFAVMGWNFERGVGEAIHSFGHRAESIMVHCYGSWAPNRNTTWNRFTLLDRDAPGLGGVGNVHFPVNGLSDYDYNNARSVQSNADAWYSYPALNNDRRSFNAREWSPNSADPQREYLNWWYAHMPHVPGRAPDGKLADWWRYLTDIDQFTGDCNMSATPASPSVSVTRPAQGASVSGDVAITASASAPATGVARVDLWVDGEVVGTDTMSPYTFVWRAPSEPGAHQIVARAYDLAAGLEGASPIRTVYVGPPPPTEPDLRPFTPPGHDGPIVAGTVPGTHTNGDLIAGADAYVDWWFENGGDTSAGPFRVDVWVDAHRLISYPWPGLAGGASGGFDDWRDVITAPGRHTVRMVVDPTNAVDESDETNNEWRGEFTWRPNNDDFGRRSLIMGTSGTTAGDSRGATRQSGEPNHAGVAGGRSVWWRWVAPASGNVTIKTRASGFDTVLGVYRGAPVSALTLVRSNDDITSTVRWSKVTFRATRGATYQIVVDGHGTASGTIQLGWRMG